MSDPPCQPLGPLYTGPPEIHYGNQGNHWVCYRNGNFVPYHEPQRAQQAGPTPQGPQVLQATLDARANGAPSQPMEQAFEFSLWPVQHGSQHPIPINPALQTPLPHRRDLDLTHTGTITDAKGLKRGDKVAGSRCNGKSKERADTPKKRAYGKTELQHLFSCVEDVLPIGAKGWKEAEYQYNKWAKANGYAVRPPKAIENKFKGVCDLAACETKEESPPEVKRAHELELLMNERIGTRELSGTKLQSDIDSSDIEVTAIARCAPSLALKRKARTCGSDLAAKLSTAFDPQLQWAHNNAPAQRSLETTQIITLTQQLCDAHALSEGLRTQNTLRRPRVKILRFLCF
ncbi:hypothetical protein B0H16DRAFT_1480028 [Mycena metata]|uniref:Uncharacterized protein n=1 Tax=Mycena metata TaxID=1033252 RepID=A0AAD7MDL4_9AGAR|nr:hypothetical protein B0H16DRAFT_1480028 [Mycena metata]